MLTYQARERVLRLAGDKTPSFPADAVIRVHLLPEHPFGESEEGGRAAVRGKGVSILFNGNNGRHEVRSKLPLKPLEVLITEGARTVSVKGRVVELRERFDTYAKLTRTIEGLYFGLPWLLNVRFQDPPYVERVEGEVGGIPFEWLLKAWRFNFAMTTQDDQERSVARSWMRFDTLTEKGRRLSAALHYFHVACRLERSGEAPGEFLSEVLLNLSKCLEVLFPGAEGVKSQDAVREGLRAAGVPEDEIEARFVPVLILRNQIDVGHPHLSVFSRKQVGVLHEFLETAEDHFRSLLDRLLEKARLGVWAPPPYEDLTPRPEAVRTIERMAESLAADPRRAAPPAQR